MNDNRPEFEKSKDAIAAGTPGITRRKMLGSAGWLGASLAAGLQRSAAQEASPRESDKPNKQLKIVVTGGHPGDPEYGCGGTIARFTELGHDVTLLYLNEGDWGEISADTRLAEAKDACGILKARPKYAGQRNGKAVIDEARYEDFRKILLAETPSAVFTQWPIDNHRDHRAIAMLTYDAWKQAGRTFALYYYEVSNGEDTVQFSPTHYVDIGSSEPRKRSACYAHASQTPDRYYALQDQIAKFRGLECGCVKAEAFFLLSQSPFDALTLFSKQRL